MRQKRVHAVEHGAGEERADRLDLGAGGVEALGRGLRPRRRSRDRPAGRQPASSSRPMLQAAQVALEPRPVDVLRPAGSCVSRSSGCASTPISSAASATLRVIGPAHAAGVGRVDRNPAEAGLEGEDAAPAGRQAQRAADVGADVQRPVAGRDRRAGAGAAAARVPCSGPRGCAPAHGSSTGPTTACRSRASSSCRGSPRPPRASAPPAARRAPPARASLAAVPSGHRRRRGWRCSP